MVQDSQRSQKGKTIKNKPETLHVVGFSGGIASAVCAKIVHDENPNNTILLFHNTYTEPADNDRFRKEASKYIGLPIIDDSDGRDIWKVFEDNSFLGNGRNTMCSRILKQERSMEFMLYYQPATIYIGFTFEEIGRAQRTKARYKHKGVECRFPLIEKEICKEECMQRVTNCWGIRKPQMYKWASHANCIPCVKGKKAYWGLIYMFEREAWDRASAAEVKHGHSIFTEAGSLKAELDNCLRLAKKYLLKKEQTPEDLFNFPCECAV